ncbi:hypothetical protein FACS189451_09830 [Bacteroidia bacterium]|nr:hypothetical protein FACS189451_09830 [Bacteroidia bacterium]
MKSKENTTLVPKRNRIILIGNGFDMAHRLKTSYKNFVDDFWANQFDIVKKDVFEDSYRDNSKWTVTENNDNSILIENDCYILKVFADSKMFASIEDFRRNIVIKNKFLEAIEQDLTIYNWVDIEQLYFNKLVECKNSYTNNKENYKSYSIEKLNKDFDYIKDKLEKYLSGIKEEYIDKNFSINTDIKDIIYNSLDKEKGRLLFLNFNYTDTERYYEDKSKCNNIKIIHIHGELNNKYNPMIFGYGDEIDKDSAEIENLNNNDFLLNVKSVRYSKSKNYQDLKEWIDEIGDEKYEIFVFGHSCGNSDRTLLNMLFEDSGKCREKQSIKIYYHKENETENNFDEVSTNIYRNFEKKVKFRERIVDFIENDYLPQTSKKETDVITETVNNVSFKMIMVDGGNFVIGSQSIDPTKPNYTINYSSGNEDLHKVELNDFYIAETQVTQELWQSVMRTNLSNFKTDGNYLYGFQNEKLPVENVSWYDAVIFCNVLSQMTGKQPYYKFLDENEQEIHIAYNHPNADDLPNDEEIEKIKDVISLNTNGFRLPTEAEWEVAARGGKKSKKFKYSGSNFLETVGWFNRNGNGTTHEVAKKQTNELGIYDMSGNVYEWCFDWYNSKYNKKEVKNPKGPPKGDNKVVRGGSWIDDAEYCVVSNRLNDTPERRTVHYGFRIVCSS